MAISKAAVLAIIEDMPDVIDLDEFMNEVILHAKIELARRQIANGDVLTEQELDKEVDSWNYPLYFKP